MRKLRLVACTCKPELVLVPAPDHGAGCEMRVRLIELDRTLRDPDEIVEWKEYGRCPSCGISEAIGCLSDCGSRRDPGCG